MMDLWLFSGTKLRTKFDIIKLNNPYIILPPDYECFFSTIEDYIHANNISQSTKTLRNFAAFISANKTTHKGIITIDTLCKILTVFGFIIGMISIAK